MDLVGDFHIHTDYSRGSYLKYDGLETPENMVRAAKYRGLDFIGITDHDEIDGIDRALAQGKKSGVTVLPGMELSVKNLNRGWSEKHLLLLGDCVKSFNPNNYETVEEIFQYFKDNNGLAYPAHPFAPYGMKEIVGEPYVEVIEERNSFAPPLANLRAHRAVKRLGKIGVAGSDSHIVNSVGNVVNKVDADDNNVDSILEAVRKGCVETEKKWYTTVNDFKKIQLERYRLELEDDERFKNEEEAKNYLRQVYALGAKEYLEDFHLGWLPKYLSPFLIKVFDSALEGKKRAGLFVGVMATLIYFEDLTYNSFGLVKDILG